MVNSAYMDIVCEHYDLSDSHTFDKVILCTEAEKQTLITNLTAKLYNNIRNKVDQIDFGTIPLSKGDITKIDGYENLVDCLNTISQLIKEYNQPTTQVDIVSTALDNIQTRTPVWKKAFTLNTELPMIMYNTMTLAIVSAVSLLITTCIEYIKNGDGTITTAFDKASYIKSKDHVLFVSLKDFNAGCSKGETDKLMNNCIKYNVTKIREFCENGMDPELALLEIEGSTAAIISGVVLVGLNIKWILEVVIYMLRNTIYYFLYMRQSVAEYFNLQADFLQMNAENLKYRIEDDNKRSKIQDKQLKWVDKFRKWANFFMIKDKKAQNDAEKQQKEDSKKGKYEDNDDGKNDDGGLF